MQIPNSENLKIPAAPQPFLSGGTAVPGGVEWIFRLQGQEKMLPLSRLTFCVPYTWNFQGAFPISSRAPLWKTPNLILRHASNRQLTRILHVCSSDYLPLPWKAQSGPSLVLALLEIPVPAHKALKKKCRFSKDAQNVIAFKNTYSMR